MSYAIFTGKQRSLVFPIMCNGFLTLDYTDNVASTGTGIPYGLWDLDNNFTFECVLTPYEINGYGTYRTAGSITKPDNITQTSIGSGHSFNANNKKIMPGLSQAVFTATEQNNFESELYDLCQNVTYLS